MHDPLCGCTVLCRVGIWDPVLGGLRLFRENQLIISQRLPIYSLPTHVLIAVQCNFDKNSAKRGQYYLTRDPKSLPRSRYMCNGIGSNYLFGEN